MVKCVRKITRGSALLPHPVVTDRPAAEVEADLPVAEAGDPVHPVAEVDQAEVEEDNVVVLINIKAKDLVFPGLLL